MSAAAVAVAAAVETFEIVPLPTYVAVSLDMIIVADLFMRRAERLVAVVTSRWRKNRRLVATATRIYASAATYRAVLISTAGMDAAARREKCTLTEQESKEDYSLHPPRVLATAIWSVRDALADIIGSFESCPVAVEHPTREETLARVQTFSYLRNLARALQRCFPEMDCGCCVRLRDGEKVVKGGIWKETSRSEVSIEFWTAMHGDDVSERIVERFADDV